MMGWERGDMTLTVYGAGNRWAQAEWLRRLAAVLEREAVADGDPRSSDEDQHEADHGDDERDDRDGVRVHGLDASRNQVTVTGEPATLVSRFMLWDADGFITPPRSGGDEMDGRAGDGRSEL